jgi:hypothetical protein
MPCCLASSRNNDRGGGEHEGNIDKVSAPVKGYDQILFKTARIFSRKDDEFAENISANHSV